MNTRINKENINIDEIISIYLKDKDGNMVEIFEKDFNYDYMYNSSGNKKLNIRCDLSNKNKNKVSSSTVTVLDPGLGLARANEGWTIPNNTFNRDYAYASCTNSVDAMPLSISRDDKVVGTVVKSAELSQTWGEAIATDCISAKRVK